MPYVQRGIDPFDHFRLLISGLPNRGKTTSLPTFIYGEHEYTSDDIHTRSEAEEYAAQKTMAILVCPGETGYRSLPPDNDHITSFILQVDNPDMAISAAQSGSLLHEFFTLNKDIMLQKPDVLVWDGLHWLYAHMLNITSNGEYLQGADMDISASGRTVQYRASKFYNRAAVDFGRAFAAAYSSTVPMFIGTVWEKWEEVAAQGDRPDVQATRYLWPDLPGGLALRVSNMFDARLSAQLGRRCLVVDCEDTHNNNEHYLWQFADRDNVRGTGVKGLHLTKHMQRCPFIHQNGDYLKQLVGLR